MNSTWWQLSGPSRFVGRVAQDLQDGKSVVLCLPQHFPEGLSRAIRAQIDYDSWPWTTLPVAGLTDREPADFLYSMFVRADTPQGLCTAATLVQEDAFAGRIIWLNGITAETWPVWSQFIAEYTDACRMRTEVFRTVFVVPLIGELASEPPPDDICLSIHTWRGIVSRLDMLLFTASILPDQRCHNATERQLLVHCIAQLALWDPSIAEILVHEQIATILQPHYVLTECARQRCWNTEIAKQPDWCQGIVDHIDGLEEIHSAMCVKDQLQRKIEHRIWAAQVGVLFPFIEEQRQDLLLRLQHYISVPFKTSQGATIENTQDLEIGHIYFQLAELRRNGIRPSSLDLTKVIGRVNTLRLMRNDLAHLKSISAEQIQQLRNM